MAWVSQQPWQPDGPPQLRFCEPGGWRVASFELAPQIAHIHANVLKAVRAALRDDHDLADGDIIWSHYQGPHSKRRMPCRLLSRKALIATFEHLHNVPGCPDIGAVLAEYLRQFDEKEAAEPAPVEPSKWLQAFRQSERYQELLQPKPEPPLFEQWSERRRNRQSDPAPDSEIRPPDPEPADTLLSSLEPTLEPVARVPDLIRALAAVGAPQHFVQGLTSWYSDVQWDELQRRARSWTEVGEIFREHQVSAKQSLVRGGGES
jgi:hypothetical protein